MRTVNFLSKLMFDFESQLKKITVYFCLLQRFALNKHLQVIFSTENHEFEKSTQTYVNLECSAWKYKSARASNFGKSIGPSNYILFIIYIYNIIYNIKMFSIICNILYFCQFC